MRGSGSCPSQVRGDTRLREAVRGARAVRRDVRRSRLVAGSAYVSVWSLLQTAWSSTLRVSQGVSWTCAGREYSRQGSTERPFTLFLYAMRVPSGERDGHSTFS